MEMESVFLDNLPDTANMILNILWDRNGYCSDHCKN